MVMKISSVNNVVFRSASVSTPDDLASNKTSKKQINELNKVTPDYSVITPVSYKNNGIFKLDNGLKIYSYKMANGYKVNIVPMKNSPAIVKTYVNVGSMNETHDIKGISHFLEHMAFNGTNGENGHIELKQGDSFKKIDRLGGWANASTNYALTDYVNSSPLLEDKDLETQIQVLASMTEDLKLSEDMIKKEKGPVSSEINMIMDNPQTVCMDQTVRTLFNIQNPADELVGGSVDHIQNLTRKNVVDYYNKYYTPENINIVVTGDVNPDEVIKIISKNFTSKKVFKGNRYEEKMTPITSTVRKDFKSNKTASAQICIGFIGPQNNDSKGKVLNDLAGLYITSHGFGMNSKLKRNNVYPLLSSEKISTNPKAPMLNYMVMSCSDASCEKSLQTVFDKLKNNKPISKEMLEHAKQALKQANEEILEHSEGVNLCIGQAVLDNNLEYITNYNKILDSITPEELNKAVNEYFDISRAAVTVVHPELKSDNKDKITFKGASNRVPIDINEVSEFKLSNNYDVGFYNTNSNNMNVEMKLVCNVPYTKKAGVAEVLNQIYLSGLKGVNADKFDEFKENNNLYILTSVSQNGINMLMRGDKNNYELGIKAMQVLLFNPDISEESIKRAVAKIKDAYSRSEITSGYIQNRFDEIANPFVPSYSEIVQNLDNITVEDVEELHKYLLKNSYGVVAANVPKNAEQEIKSNILKSFGRMKDVEQKNVRQIEIYREINKPLVFTAANKNSQADISQVYRFKYNNTVKEKAVGTIMNYILSSSSIGLFDILREKENLAYSVHSDITNVENQGKLTLNILTTTDNKDIGEISYQNVQKSIEGFNRQLKALIDGQFTDEDLENAKRSFKASLINNESNLQKMFVINAGMCSPDGINMRNKVYKEIDKVTKEDIMNYAKQITSNYPVYSITATQDTLDANKEFLENLKNNY